LARSAGSHDAFNDAAHPLRRLAWRLCT
jgi:hypothetical protein